MIKVNYSDYTEDTYETEKDAEDAILEAHAEGVSVDYISDENGNHPYSCIWSVKLQKEQ